MNTIIISAICGVVMMFGGFLFKKKTTPKYYAIAGLIILFVSNALELWGWQFFDIDMENNTMFKFNDFGLAFNGVALLATLLFVMLNGRDIEKVGKHVSEYFALIFFILCGVGISSSYNTLLMLFLGIEIMSIPLYILTGSDKLNLKGNEASLKYFLMGAFSTGLMLMGIAFIYGGNSAGSFAIDNIDIGGSRFEPMIAIGLILMLAAMSFKVSAVPFHFWTPDVYDGAPTVFTSFMATVVKSAGFVAFIILFENVFSYLHAQWQILIAIITAATLLIGNLTAVFQQSVKRMLAYSSIAQAGFMLLALFAMNDTGKDGLILYTAAYSLASIGMFAVLVRMKDYTIEGFNGLSKHQPVLALCATIFLLSLTGIPLTAGFTAKFYMLIAAVKQGHQFWLVIFAVLCAAISAYYYFRVIQAMYFKPLAHDVDQSIQVPAMDVNNRFKFLLILVAVLIILLGVLPNLVIDWLHY
jgi:NADH-quinone oxidoreductase subunit N